jgi:hypothetical protein
VLAATKTGDSTFTLTSVGKYKIEVDNTFATKLTLHSNEINVTVLPLTLLSFTGAPEKNTVALHWQTANEINTNDFAVQRSAGAANFATLTVVKAANAPGVQNYSFVDVAPLAGTNYYRLLMRDKNGHYTYSKVLPVNVSGVKNAFTVYPNPAKNIGTVAFAATAAGKYQIEITDGLGKAIKRMEGVATIGQNNVSFDVSRLAKGIYVITLTNNGVKQSFKLVKE